MNPRITTVLLVLLLLLPGACRTATVESLAPEMRARGILPRVEIVIDKSVQETFPTESWFSGRKEQFYLGYHPATMLDGTTVNVAPTVHIPGAPEGTALHPLMLNIASASIRQHLGSVFSAGPSVKGAKLICRAADAKVAFNWAWIIPSALTLGTLNLLGMPGNSYSATVDVTVELRGPGGSKLAEYTARGTGRAYSGLYWNFAPGRTTTIGDVEDPNEHTHASIAAKAGALSDALKKILVRFEADAPKLRSKLTRR
jgi:hypothetical protein